MNVYTCNTHDGHYPVGAASVVVAKTETDARELLGSALIEAGLKPSEHSPYTLVLLDTRKPHAVILLDGDY